MRLFILALRFLKLGMGGSQRREAFLTRLQRLSKAIAFGRVRLFILALRFLKLGMGGSQRNQTFLTRPQRILNLRAGHC